MYNKEAISKVIESMDKHLRNDLLKDKSGHIQNKKLWENTYIKHQIEKRKRKYEFSLEEHICGMVYSMLSSTSAWDRMDGGIDEKTGKIVPVNQIFSQDNIEYAPEFILSCTPELLTEKIKNICGGTQSTRKQMEALIQSNVPLLMKLEKQYGSIDMCYQQYIEKDKTLKTLITLLSSPNSYLKMSQMGEALVAEYLRNVGYDIAKPDRHTRRILGSEFLGCSDKKIVPIFETLDIIKELADYMKRDVAEIDYILWSYCAKRYGEICTLKNPKCEMCVAKKYCNYFKHNLDAKGVIRNE